MVAALPAAASAMRMMWPLMLPGDPAAAPAYASPYERGLAASTTCCAAVAVTLRLLLLVSV